MLRDASSTLHLAGSRTEGKDGVMILRKGSRRFVFVAYFLCMYCLALSLKYLHHCYRTVLQCIALHCALLYSPKRPIQHSAAQYGTEEHSITARGSAVQYSVVQVLYYTVTYGTVRQQGLGT